MSQEKMPVRLPVVQFEGKRYYLDLRLRQLRNVENPHDYVDYADDWLLALKEEHRKKN